MTILVGSLYHIIRVWPVQSHRAARLGAFLCCHHLAIFNDSEEGAAFWTCRRLLPPSHPTGHFLQLLKVTEWNAAQQATQPIRQTLVPSADSKVDTICPISASPEDTPVTLRREASFPVPQAFQGAFFGQILGLEVPELCRGFHTCDSLSRRSFTQESIALGARDPGLSS